MNEKSYPFDRPRIDFRYEFDSISDEKQVRKIVHFTPTDLPNFYNLALLDVLPDGSTSDISETNNKDMKTVLATVVRITLDFFNQNPGTLAIFQGSDARRQRLYRIMIDRELELIQQQFSILGSNGDSIEPFERNHPYKFFIISKFR